MSRKVTMQHNSAEAAEPDSSSCLPVHCRRSCLQPRRVASRCPRACSGCCSPGRCGDRNLFKDLQCLEVFNPAHHNKWEFLQAMVVVLVACSCLRWPRLHAESFVMHAAPSIVQLCTSCICGRSILVLPHAWKHASCAIGPNVAPLPVHSTGEIFFLP